MFQKLVSTSVQYIGKEIVQKNQENSRKPIKITEDLNAYGKNMITYKGEESLYVEIRDLKESNGYW